jgi:hypothetical protein
MKKTNLNLVELVEIKKWLKIWVLA